MEEPRSVIPVFAFENRPVRVELIDGEPWWVVKDISIALGYADSSDPNKLVMSVPDEWKGRKRIPTPGGVQEMSCLSEQGLYFFLARSDKPAAFAFQKWIAGTVIPSIRKTGQYSVLPTDPTLLGLPNFNDPFAAAEAWIVQGRKLQATEATMAKLVAKAVVDAPRLQFAAAVEASDTTYLVGNVAKIIQQGTGEPCGTIRLYTWLRAERYLHQGGDQKNEPTQRSLNAGWFKIQERVCELPDGREKVTRTTRITGKGKLHIYAKWAAIARANGRTPGPCPDEAPDDAAHAHTQLALWDAPAVLC
jgi:anti-repressor protein